MLNQAPRAVDNQPSWRTRTALAVLVVLEGAAVVLTTVIAGLRTLFWVDAAGVVALVGGAELAVFALVALGLAGGRRWARALAFALNLLLIVLTLAATPNQVRSIALYVELHNRIGPLVDHSYLPDMATGLAIWAAFLVLTLAAIGLLLRTRPAEPAENA